MRTVISGVCFFLLLARLAWGVESTGTVSCTSASVAVQVVATIGGGTVVNVPSTAGTGVYIVKDNSTSCANSTAGTGYPIGPSNGYDFLPREDGYTGQLCCLLWSGSTAVTIGYNKR